MAVPQTPLGPRQGRIYVNGKFLGGELNGLHRVGAILIRGLQDLLAENQRDVEIELDVLMPRRTAVNPAFGQFAPRPIGRLRGQPWEQLELLAHARRGLLLNLCNLAPAWHPNMAVMVHDAQPFIDAEAYPPSLGIYYRRMFPLIGHRARRVYTVSDFSAGQLVRYGIASPDKIKVIRNGIDHFARIASDPAGFRQHGLGEQGYVLSIGSTKPYKNLKVLFEAFASPRLAGLKLVLVGGTTAAEFRAAGLEPPPGTVLVGRISDGVLRGLYERALAVAIPSLTEGFGLPPLEAMLCGCPAIIARAGAMPEVCGDAAMQVLPHDVAGWVQAIERVRDDKELRSGLSGKGSQRAAQFTWRRSAEALFDDVLRLCRDEVAMS